MIVPSIDIKAGRAVQLRRGREFILDGGDPMERLEQFAIAGEVALIDLDAALGCGSNAEIIHEMARSADCRVGGGVRDIKTAEGWLDAGACKVIIGTAASLAFCSKLPRERVIAAVDADRGRVVVDGWQTRTKHNPIDRIIELAPAVGGFLLTQVEREGDMRGFDIGLIEQAIEAAGDARVTAAGGITSVEEIAALDRMGADAQVGMALYSERLSLGDAVGAPLARAVDGRLWPTVVCDENGTTLGLVWSTRESLSAAVEYRRGIYWSRSRNELWVKGTTSGATQELVRVDLDCDRDALRFTVRQHGSGFCHTGEKGCWPTRFHLASLSRVIADRHEAADPASGTARLFADTGLLRSKLIEEATELADAETVDATRQEAADLFYFALVAAERSGVSPESVVKELELRHRRVSRRPMKARPSGSKPDAAT